MQNDPKLFRSNHRSTLTQLINYEWNHYALNRYSNPNFHHDDRRSMIE